MTTRWVEGSPLWGLPRTPPFPDLQEDIACDVAVVGAGFTGLMLALELNERGFDTVVLETDRIGSGSTRASTALLLWETDTDLHVLGERLGSEAAARVWRGCYDALAWCESCSATWRLPSFRRTPSVYYAAQASDRERLAREVEARRRAGLPSRFVEDPYPYLGFHAPGAILNEGAGSADPATLLEELASAAARSGLRVFERSRATRLRAREVGGRGFRVRADRVVVAAGLGVLSSFPVPPLVKPRVTFVVAVEGVPEECPDPAIAWSTARPYAYLRRAGRHVLLGGEDMPPGEASRAGARPYATLRARLAGLYPSLADAPERARWSGLFPNSPDGLPYIGPLPGLGGADALLSFGGNGMVFGLLGASLMARSIAGEDVAEELALYAYERLSREDRTRLQAEVAGAAARG